MNVFPTVYLTVFLYVVLAVYLAVFLYVFPTVFLAVFFVHIHNRHGAVTAASRSPAPARGLCKLRRAVPTAICRAAAQAQADRRIQSDQVCATEQRRPAATCTGAPWLRAEVPWQSWLAVDHDVTAEQRRPSDVEMLSSLSNRQPLPRKRSFLEATAHRNPSTENQRKLLQRY